MSLERDAESVEILLLQGQAALSGFAIKHFDEDTNPDIDRIIVKAEPRQVEVPGPSQNQALLWRIPVIVTVHYATQDASAFDTVVAAVEAANVAPFPGAAVTAATNAFNGGPDIDATDDGELDHSDNARTRSKTFNFVVNA